MTIVLIWGLYSLMIAFFPVFSRSCFRTGRRLPGRSLLNGGALFGGSLAVLFCLLFLTRGAGGVGIGGIFLIFQIAGLAVGLVALGGLLGFIDTEKKPYGALALGMAMLWIVRMFSEGVSNILCLLIGIYGVGAIILYFRGQAPEAPRSETLTGMTAQPPPAAAPEQKPGAPEKKYP
ncbi:MAG: hypothetical protein HY796_10675 [Elusimicrobia bacterium]|nr:hypothetical protein [Elusimicrobiota bacterium]